MGDLIQQIVQWLLVGGGLIGLLQFYRDRKKNKNEADNVNLDGSHTAVGTLKEALKEVKELLEEEREESTRLRKTLRDEREIHANDLAARDADIRMLTQRLAEAINLHEVTQAQLEDVRAELARIREKYNIED